MAKYKVDIVSKERDDFSIECNDVQVQENFVVFVTDEGIDSFSADEIYSMHVRILDTDDTPPWSEDDDFKPAA